MKVKSDDTDSRLLETVLFQEGLTSALSLANELYLTFQSTVHFEKKLICKILKVRKFVLCLCVAAEFEPHMYSCREAFF